MSKVMNLIGAYEDRKIPGKLNVRKKYADEAMAEFTDLVGQRDQALKDLEESKLKFDEEVKWILGRPNFSCIGFANALRKSGMHIERKAEDEQAAVIYWMLEMYRMHGKNWRKAADEFLRQVSSY